MLLNYIYGHIYCRDSNNEFMIHKNHIHLIYSVLQMLSSILFVFVLYPIHVILGT